MKTVIEILHERGFVEQATHEEELTDFFKEKGATVYVGFDPTASSLHVGSLIPIMALAHMQMNGHRPIALVGGGTGLVGDPSGKTEMRQMLTLEDVEKNAAGIKNQLSSFLDFSEGKALLLNNADWLVKLEYIPFLREIGRHFSVNRMIKAESYKMRLDSDEGLNFIEFNYMVLQSYDFLELFDKYGCRLQMGGSDQWGNIVSGIDLIRRMRQKTTFGLTFPLITTSGGAKMGKTAKGAVWLDPERTAPYDYFQYWINTDDRDVPRFLSLFTFLPMDEIGEVNNLEGAALNAAKSVLAFETTRLAHGEAEALKAFRGAMDMFGIKPPPEALLPSSSVLRAGGGKKGEDAAESSASADVPHSYFDEADLKGLPLFKVFYNVGLTGSGGEARRLIQQGGAYVNEERVASVDRTLGADDVREEEILLRAGKKRYHKIIVRKNP